MTRKKGGKKKTDSGKASLHKLESRLLGYWKRKSWGEFVTLFQRHWARAQKTQAAACWDAAVYNLLLSSLFESQDLPLLQHIVHELIDPQTISDENQNCLQVASTFLALYHGQAGAEAAQDLPSELPDPFAKLSMAMRDISQMSSTSLGEYVQEKRTKARKGERHLALTARIGKQYNVLRKQDFQSPTIQPFTQLRKSLRDLQATVQDHLNINSPILNNMVILADLLRTMHSPPRSLISPAQVVYHLQDKGFQPSTHSAVESLACGVLALGRKRLGAKWEDGVRVSLRGLLPGLAPDLPPHIEQQFQSLHHVSQKEPFVTQLIPEMLKHDVWSARERMLLLLAQLHIAANAGDDLADYLEDMISGPAPEKQIAQVIIQHIVQTIHTLEQVIDLHAQLGLQDASLLDQATRQWQEAIAHFPSFHVFRHLDKLLVTMCASPVPDAALLFVIMKRVEHAPNVQGIKSIDTVLQERAPLHASEQELHRIADKINEQSNLANIFRAWQSCMAEEDYQRLVQLFLQRVFHETCKEQSPLDFLFDNPCLGWPEIPPSLMQDFAQILSPDFSLYGLVLLSAQKNTTDCPTPKNATEAQCFLDHLPPPEILDDMLEWMLTWPTTPYRNTFLAAVITHHADYLTQNKGWVRLVRDIQLNRLNKLAELVWDIWQELDLFSRLGQDQDFRSARDILQPLAYKSKKSRASSSGRKKKTLLDEVLEEKKKKSKKNKS
ncbi:MAG: hypothetical protein R6V55_09485 [Desulfovermiculus sp.]